MIIPKEVFQKNWRGKIYESKITSKTERVPGTLF